MSVRNPRIVVSSRAQNDIEDIITYSLRHWGEAQAERYAATLIARIDHIKTNPSLGVERPDIGPDIRVLPAGQHRIIYRLAPTLTLVLRVVHQRQSDVEL